MTEERRRSNPRRIAACARCRGLHRDISIGQGHQATRFRCCRRREARADARLQSRRPWPSRLRLACADRPPARPQI